MGEHTTNIIEDRVTSTKKKLKKICCCAVVWTLVGIISIVIGIALLAAFAKYWNDKDHWERGLAYFGLVLLLLSFLFLGIGIILCATLCIVYKRLDRGEFATVQFKPPVNSYGNAPYPQQPQVSPVYNSMPSGDQKYGAMGSPTHQPSAPPANDKPPHDNPPPMDTGAIELEEHHKY